MAISSSLSSSTLFPSCNSTLISSKPKKIPSTLSFLPSVSKQQQLMMQLCKLSTTRVFAAPELLDSDLSDSNPKFPEFWDESPDFYDPNSPEVESFEISDWDEGRPDVKIRIKLNSYFVPLIEHACTKIVDLARKTNAKVSGPVPLPTRKKIYCVLKSPHVHKDARFHFEIRTHSRLIDIHYPTANTIDALLLVDLPPAVDLQLTY